MSSYQIMSDSCVDLTAQMVEQLGLIVLPLKVHLKGNSYPNTPDGKYLSVTEFYAQLREGVMPTTSQVNVEEFKQAFVPYLEKGQDVLYLGFSSGLSGTYNSARIAAQELSEQYSQQTVIAIDTLAASMGQGLLAYHACNLQKEGQSIAEVAQWVQDNKLRLAHWFTVDDLNHLKRGGRVSGATAFVGTMLNIKPVLHVDQEGHLVPKEKLRGRKASIEALVQHMQQGAINPKEQTIFISHGDCIEDAQLLADTIRQKIGVTDIHINFVGPVIGAHSGPGTLALFYLANSRD